MINEKVFCNHGCKEGSTIGDVMREPQPRSESPNAPIFVTANKQMEGVEDVKPSKYQCLPHVIDRYIVPKPVIQAPVTVRKRRPAGHDLQGQHVFLK